MGNILTNHLMSSFPGHGPTLFKIYFFLFDFVNKVFLINRKGLLREAIAKGLNQLKD